MHDHSRFSIKLKLSKFYLPHLLKCCPVKAIVKSGLIHFLYMLSDELAVIETWLILSVLSHKRSHVSFSCSWQQCITPTTSLHLVTIVSIFVCTMIHRQQYWNEYELIIWIFTFQHSFCATLCSQPIYTSCTSVLYANHNYTQSCLFSYIYMHSFIYCHLQK